MSPRDHPQPVVGRFAPSPSGRLHLGNLRTAMTAWLLARSEGGGFVLRLEDLDPVTSSDDHEAVQLADLRAIGLDWDGEPLRQSSRRGAHEAALEQLVAAGATYECFCSRKEALAAASAPHGQLPRYAGTCRELSDRQRADRRAEGRRPVLRLRAEAGAAEAFVDAVHGPSGGPVGDVVLRRADGVPAYNLAVVVDDVHQGVNQVVRGDDLLAATAEQVHLARLLGLPVPGYAHVPLVLGPSGQRLAKRDGAVTLDALADRGVPVARVVGWLAASFGWCEAGAEPALSDLLDRATMATIPREPWTFHDGALV